MFAIGSYVSYRAEGVCVISDVREERFSAQENAMKYYILSPLGDEKSTLFVPVDNETLVGMMRPLLTAEEITSLAEELHEERMEWIEESRLRNLRFREILSEGDRRNLIVLINTVMAQYEDGENAGKKMGTTDDNALRRAKSLLFEEFSMTTDLQSSDEVLLLLKGEKTIHAKELCAAL